MTETHRILITGSRNWTDGPKVRDAIHYWAVALGGDVVVVHGDCPTGADRLADISARTILGLPVEKHPADWGIPRDRSAGPRRNQKMVDLGADVCIAFPLGESRGTRHCMAAAKAAGIPVVVIEP